MLISSPGSEPGDLSLQVGHERDIRNTDDLVTKFRKPFQDPRHGFEDRFIMVELVQPTR